VERVFICLSVKLNGEKAIALKKMGRPVGSNGVLTSEQEELTQNLLIETTPDVHGYNGFLWDNGSIQQLIKDKFCIEIRRTTLDNYLKRWGFTSQRPVIYRRQQNEAAVEKG
jgi:transposase